MEKVTEKTEIRLAPKGLILLALGGYMDKNKGLTAKQQTEAVITMLTDFMQKNSYALLVIDGKLDFVAVRESTTPE